MTKIVKFSIEHFPPSKLIGKRYTNADRINGNYGHKWEAWFASNTEAMLSHLNPTKENQGSPLGMMRIENNEVIYWIGQLFQPDTPCPDGFDAIDIEAKDFGVCWIYGNPDNGELYGFDVHQRCVQKIQSHGFKRIEDDWCIERYVCPRFSTPDKDGKVILDYCLAIEQ